MGDAKAGPVRLSCNPQFRVEFHGATVTVDVGLLLLPRELDERLTLGEMINRHLTDPPTGRNYQRPLPGLFQSGPGSAGNNRRPKGPIIPKMTSYKSHAGRLRP